MLRKIDWYVIRETIPPFLLSLVIFTFLLEIPPVMRDLEMLVAKGVSWQVAGRIVLTLIPQALGLTIPMALLTGLLIGLGRLSTARIRSSVTREANGLTMRVRLKRRRLPYAPRRAQSGRPRMPQGRESASPQ